MHWKWSRDSILRSSEFKPQNTLNVLQYQQSNIEQSGNSINPVQNKRLPWQL